MNTTSGNVPTYSRHKFVLHQLPGKSPVLPPRSFASASSGLATEFLPLCAGFLLKMRTAIYFLISTG